MRFILASSFITHRLTQRSPVAGFASYPLGNLLAFERFGPSLNDFSARAKPDDATRNSSGDLYGYDAIAAEDDAIRNSSGAWDLYGHGAMVAGMALVARTLR